jgi:hypothetical protein
MGEVVLEDQSLAEEWAPKSVGYGCDDDGVKSFEDVEVAPAVVHQHDLFLEWLKAP